MLLFFKVITKTLNKQSKKVLICSNSYELMVQVIIVLYQFLAIKNTFFKGKDLKVPLLKHLKSLCAKEQN